MPRAITRGVIGWRLGRVKTFLSNPAMSNSGIGEEKGREEVEDESADLSAL
jgi:hypothetical protein